MLRIYYVYKSLFIWHTLFIYKEKMKFYYFEVEYNFRKLNTVSRFLWTCNSLPIMWSKLNKCELRIEIKKKNGDIQINNSNEIQEK
jgi:hypothetical protein